MSEVRVHGGIRAMQLVTFILWWGGGDNIVCIKSMEGVVESPTG